MFTISENYDNILYKQSDIILDYNPGRMTAEIPLNPPIPLNSYQHLIFYFEIIGENYYIFYIPVEDEVVLVSDVDGNNFTSDFPVLYLKLSNNFI